MELEAAVTEFNTRNKHIKLADQSEGGWKVVDEYKEDELADDSDDAKKIRKARKAVAAAEAKSKASRRSRKFVPYTKSRPTGETYPNQDSRVHSSFRRYYGAGRLQPSSSGYPSTSRAYPAAQGDYCFGCGKLGLTGEETAHSNPKIAKINSKNPQGKIM